MSLCYSLEYISAISYKSTVVSQEISLDSDKKWAPAKLSLVICRIKWFFFRRRLFKEAANGSGYSTTYMGNIAFLAVSGL